MPHYPTPAPYKHKPHPTPRKQPYESPTPHPIQHHPSPTPKYPANASPSPSPLPYLPHSPKAHKPSYTPAPHHSPTAAPHNLPYQSSTPVYNYDPTPRTFISGYPPENHFPSLTAHLQPISRQNQPMLTPRPFEHHSPGPTVVHDFHHHSTPSPAPHHFVTSTSFSSFDTQRDPFFPSVPREATAKPHHNQVFRPNQPRLFTPTPAVPPLSPAQLDRTRADIVNKFNSLLLSRSKRNSESSAVGEASADSQFEPFLYHSSVRPDFLHSLSLPSTSSFSEAGSPSQQARFSSIGSSLLEVGI